MLYQQDIIPETAIDLFVIIMSDYFSLFFVRRFLRSAQIYPLRASITSSAVGMLIVVIGFLTFIAGIVILVLLLDPDLRRMTANDLDPNLNHIAIATINSLEGSFPLFLPTMAPALIVHLWLPLFALSSLAVRFVYLLFRAVEKAQWFLKQGDAHPLKAIGIVATIIVFGTATLVKEAWTVL